MKNFSFRPFLSLVFRVNFNYFGFGHHGYRDGSQCRVDRKWANLTPLCEQKLKGAVAPHRGGRRVAAPTMKEQP